MGLARIIRQLDTVPYILCAQIKCDAVFPLNIRQGAGKPGLEVPAGTLSNILKQASLK